MTDRLRSEQARAAAHLRWANEPPSERRRRARVAARRRWENVVDPDRKLSAADRAVLVDNAIKAEFARLRAIRERGQ